MVRCGFCEFQNFEERGWKDTPPPPSVVELVPEPGMTDRYEWGIGACHTRHALRLGLAQALASWRCLP